MPKNSSCDDPKDMACEIGSDEGFDQLPGDLPAIDPTQTFQFACGPDVPCFNRCCAQLSLPLTPYDVLRLAPNLQLACDEFLRTFASLMPDSQTGFPMFYLRMIESPDAPCPFVTPAGCSVYEDRPGACRSYPLGRGARMGKDGVCERYFMVREEHCKGFDSGRNFTAAEWFGNQGMERHIYFNDRYMRLLSMVKASGRPVEKKLYSIVLLSLWQMDKFGEFLQKMKIVDQVHGPAAERRELLENSLTGREARLDFGLSWLELIIFGKSEDLWRKD